MVHDSIKPDDKKLKSTASSGTTEDEEEYRKLLAALLKKMEILDTVGERLTRLEVGQEAILHHRAPEILQNRKEGPMEPRASTSLTSPRSTAAATHCRSSTAVNTTSAASEPWRRSGSG
jgi:hypothetical protein